MPDLAEYLIDEKCFVQVSYLADIFSETNKLNINDAGCKQKQHCPAQTKHKSLGIQKNVKTVENSCLIKNH